MKKIGIIGAMELEVETLKAHMTTTKITTKAHMEFHEGTLNGTPVVIVRSGVGKVNAALCVQILADLFGVTAIINTGVAGSLNAALDIGDILISRDALPRSMVISVAWVRISPFSTLSTPGLIVRRICKMASWLRQFSCRLCPAGIKSTKTCPG